MSGGGLTEDELVGLLPMCSQGDVRREYRLVEFGEAIAAAQRAAEGSDVDSVLSCSSNISNQIFKEHGLDHLIRERRQPSFTPETLGKFGLPSTTPEEVRDRDLLMRIAAHGVSHREFPLFAESFVPTSREASEADRAGPPFRARYREVRGAVHILLAKLVKAGRGIVLPKASVVGLSEYHFTSPHWTPKSGSDLGRICADASAGLTNMNSPDRGLIDRCIEELGAQDLPQFKYIAGLMLAAKQVDPDVVMSIDDVDSAFPRLPLATETVPLCAHLLEMEDGSELVFLYTSLFFGPSASPVIFEIVSRSILRKVSAYSLKAAMYVDDCLRLHTGSGTQADGERTKAVFHNFLSPHSDPSSSAWCQRKAVWGVGCAVFLGWLYDLDTMCVSLPVRGTVRFIAALRHILDREKVTVDSVERVASLCSRYSIFHSHLRAMTARAYSWLGAHPSPRPGVKGRNARKLRSREAIFPVTPELRVAMEVWLWYFLRQLRVKGAWIAPLESWNPARPTVTLQCDASLEGCGFLIPAAAVPEHLEGASPLATVEPVFGQLFYGVAFSRALTSSEQNASEVIGTVVAVTAVVRMGVRGSKLAVTSDSISVLSWLRRGVKSAKALRAFVLLGAIMRAVDLSFCDSDCAWIDSHSMGLCDRLSREAVDAGDPSVAGRSKFYSAGAWSDRMLALVDPTRGAFESVDQFEDLEARAEELTAALVISRSDF